LRLRNLPYKEEQTKTNEHDFGVTTFHRGVINKEIVLKKCLYCKFKADLGVSQHKASTEKDEENMGLT
jgi:hypothetical protein